MMFAVDFSSQLKMLVFSFLCISMSIFHFSAKMSYLGEIICNPQTYEIDPVFYSLLDTPCN